MLTVPPGAGHKPRVRSRQIHHCVRLRTGYSPGQRAMGRMHDVSVSVYRPEQKGVRSGVSPDSPAVKSRTCLLVVE